MNEKYKGIRKRGKVVGLLLVGIGVFCILLFSSVPLTLADQCETDPSQCQCSVVTCANDCAGYELDPSCVVNCLSCAFTGDPTDCAQCAWCVGFDVGVWLGCAVICQANPCLYGYVCTPCSTKDPLTKRCYDSDIYEVEICKCDGQGWGNWKRIDCPSGKSCCGSGLCVDLQTDSNNCGSCGNKCGANAHCSGGTCHCDEGYQDCDGDGNCECPPGWWCEEGECVSEASTFVLLGFGLLCVGGYFRLKRKEN